MNDIEKEIKAMKADDTKEYPKVAPQWIWDNNPAEDRTDGWK